MNGIEKFITIFFLATTSCALYQKCESNPRNAFCEFVYSRWKVLFRPQADMSRLLTTILLLAVIERERELMEDDEEEDLPEIDEDEIALEEDQMLNIEGGAHDKETSEVNELHPKLIPLLLSIVFMLINLILVLSLMTEGLVDLKKKDTQIVQS